MECVTGRIARVRQSIKFMDSLMKNIDLGLNIAEIVRMTDKSEIWKCMIANATSVYTKIINHNIPVLYRFLLEIIQISLRYNNTHNEMYHFYRA